MIATTTELDALREAGKIASNARNWAAETIKPGSLLRELQEGMETLIREAGAMPSFPAQTSRNHIAAHSCSSPSDRTRFEENDLVKIDVGAHIDGLVVDTGISADLSSDGRWSAMIGAASDALGAAIGMCSPGVYVDDIGERVEEVITAAGFRPILNLTGHGLGRWTLHDKPRIPNARMGSKARLEAGTVFAIEPFATSGQGYVDDEGDPEVFMLARNPKRSNKIDPEALAAIRSWNGLPIARRYFKRIPKKPFERTLKELVRQGVAREYPPLAEVSGAHVGWKEHTIYLGPDGPEILTV
ncbi:MAG: type II methionyl aminopeptidase [Chloroflexi bacterium]|nr:type II methionyl aminopeptidase [Chloroflexota bacterium]